MGADNFPVDESEVRRLLGLNDELEYVFGAYPHGRLATMPHTGIVVYAGKKYRATVGDRIELGDDGSFHINGKPAAPLCQACETSAAFHKVAVEQRDAAWREIERLREGRDTLAKCSCLHLVKQVAKFGRALESSCEVHQWSIVDDVLAIHDQLRAQLKDAEENREVALMKARWFDELIDGLQEILPNGRTIKGNVESFLAAVRELRAAAPVVGPLTAEELEEIETILRCTGGSYAMSYESVVEAFEKIVGAYKSACAEIVKLRVAAPPTKPCVSCGEPLGKNHYSNVPNVGDLCMSCWKKRQEQMASIQRARLTTKDEVMKEWIHRNYGRGELLAGWQAQFEKFWEHCDANPERKQ